MKNISRYGAPPPIEPVISTRRQDDQLCEGMLSRGEIPCYGALYLTGRFLSRGYVVSRTVSPMLLRNDRSNGGCGFETHDSVISSMFIEKYPFPYYFYIITNENRTVLYCGMTNNLDARLWEHESSEGKGKTFTARYNCHYLVYYEGFDFVLDAISREKEVKKWNRLKKERLIVSLNPEWAFLNDAETFDHAGRSYDSESSTLP